MVKKNKTYKFSESWWQMMRISSDEVLGAILRAICSKVFDGKTIVNIPECARETFETIDAELTEQIKKAAEVSEKRVMIGRTGGVAKQRNVAIATKNLPIASENLPIATKNLPIATKNLPIGTIPPAPPYIYINNIKEINKESEIFTREQILGWLTDNEERLKILLKRSGVISTDMSLDELKEKARPYMDEFYEHIVTHKPIEHICRTDTIRWFADWLPQYIKSNETRETRPKERKANTDGSSGKVRDYTEAF